MLRKRSFTPARSQESKLISREVNLVRPSFGSHSEAEGAEGLEVAELVSYTRLRIGAEEVGNHSDVLNRPPRLLQSDEFEALVIEHLDFARRIAWKLLHRWRVRFSEDEVQSISSTALCEAASRFDLHRGVSFRTFLFYHLRGALIREVSRSVQDSRGVPLDHTATPSSKNSLRDVVELSFFEGDQRTPEEIMIQSQLVSLCRKACSELDGLERDVLYRHFGLEQSVVQIARELGYCRCHISRIKTQVLERLQGTLRDQVEQVHAPALHPAVNKTRYTGGRGRRKVSSTIRAKAA